MNFAMKFGTLSNYKCLSVNLWFVIFCVGKIEMVKSKWGLALSAVVMVFASLLMSIGTCTFFGMTPSLNGGWVCV